jgi:hypothetical protein
MPFLAFFLKNEYLSKVLISTLVIVALISAGAALRSEYIEQGRKLERAQWEKREAEVNRQAGELMKLKEHEANLELERNRGVYLNAIQTYAKNAEDVNDQLNRANKRLYVATKSTPCNPHSSQTAPGISGTISGADKDFHKLPGNNDELRGNLVELSNEVREKLVQFAGQTELGKKDCGALLAIMEQYFEVK